MKLIAHRGNVYGPILNEENKPAYIDSAINKGYDVEIDLRFLNGIPYLGHDTPEYEIDRQWLYERRYRLWIHCKDYGALEYMTELNKYDDYIFFYHEKENHTILSNGMIWSHDYKGNNMSGNNVIPLLDMQSIVDYKEDFNMGGICSDYVAYIESRLP